MSLEQTNVVDFLSINSRDEVVLTISDHFDWNHEKEHLLMLQEKINSYLAFIESGELKDSYPMALNRRPIISIKAMFEPTSEALSLFLKVREVADSIDVGFEFELTPLIITLMSSA